MNINKINEIHGDNLKKIYLRGGNREETLIDLG